MEEEPSSDMRSQISKKRETVLSQQPNLYQIVKNLLKENGKITGHSISFYQAEKSYDYALNIDMDYLHHIN